MKIKHYIKTSHVFIEALFDTLHSLIIINNDLSGPQGINNTLSDPQGINNTLSGRIGKVVASHAAGARSSPAEVGLIYTMHEALRGYCP